MGKLSMMVDVPKKKRERRPKQRWMEVIFGGRGTGTGCLDATVHFMDNQLLVIRNIIADSILTPRTRARAT